MNKHKLLSSVTLVLCLLSTALSAQDYTFKVLGVKGESFADGTSIKVGSSIMQSQSIKVSQDGYLGLAHKNNKTLEITRPGVYQVADLEKMVLASSNDLASRYTQFLVEELTSSQDQASRFNRKAKTGSVTREVSDKPVLFMLPMDANGVSRTSKVLADTKVSIKWYLNEKSGLNASNFKFIVKDGSPDAIGDIVFETEVVGNSIELDLTKSNFRNRNVLLYQVVNGDNQTAIASEEMMLVKLDDQTTRNILAELASLPTEKTALNQLILGRFYEEKDLVANAIQAYEEALELSDLPEYRTYYENFLKQYQLDFATVTAGK